MQHDTNIFGQPIGLVVPNWKVPIFPTDEPIEGRFCRIERLNPSLHASSLYTANMLDVEGKMWTYLRYGPFATLESYTAWAEKMRCSSDPLFYAIIDKATEKAVGVASYLRIDPAVGSIEVGNISYSPLLQRTPVATEAMFLMMKQIFTLGYRRYEWKCDALNAPSRKSAERLGFSFEGVFRQDTIVRNRNRDTAWFSIIDTEWPKIRESFEIGFNPKILIKWESNVCASRK
jgi:RimJ/RimL family protein N-acetyltransferase